MPDWIADQVRKWLGDVFGGRSEAECPVCGHGFDLTGPDPGAFSLCTPADTDEPAVALISGICQMCARLGDRDLFAEVFRGLAESSIFSTLRRLDPVHLHDGGRA
jgi:hypothetical protein